MEHKKLISQLISDKLGYEVNIKELQLQITRLENTINFLGPPNSHREKMVEICREVETLRYCIYSEGSAWFDELKRYFPYHHKLQIILDKLKVKSEHRREKLFENIQEKEWNNGLFPSLDDTFGVDADDIETRVRSNYLRKKKAYPKICFWNDFLEELSTLDNMYAGGVAELEFFDFFLKNGWTLESFLSRCDRWLAII